MNSTNRKMKISIAVWSICVGWLVCMPLATVGAGELLLAPDNAALLYYRAFLLRPEHDVAVEELVYNTKAEKLYKILRGGKLEPDPEEQIKELEKRLSELEVTLDNNDFEYDKMPNPQSPLYKKWTIEEDLEELREYCRHLRGFGPNRKIRYYLWKCRKAIAVAQVASEIPECTWGTIVSQKLFYISPPIIEVREFSKLLRADALRLAADGSYRAALERCLMMRRFARHVGEGADGLVSYQIGCSRDTIALEAIRIILCSMPPDAKTLRWLQSQLVSIQQASRLFPVLMERDFKVTLLRLVRNSNDGLEIIKEQLAVGTKNENAKKRFLNLTNEELTAMVREPYASFLNSVLRAIDRDKPCEQTYARIEKLSKEFIEQNQNNPEITLTIGYYIEFVPRCYDLYVARSTWVNALKAAVEIYLIKAETGQLPKTLPSGLPKDSYSGEDFGYEITDYGFALRSQGKRFKEGRPRQMLEFKVKK